MPRRTPPARLIGSGLIPESYQGQYNAAEEDYQGQLAELQRGERGLFRDYGFTGGIGAGGEVNFGVDPTNQFGAYQGLLRNIGGQLGQAKQEVRGRGLGRAGLAKARENLIRFMMSGEKANLATGFQKAAGEIFNKRGGALTSRNRRFADLEGDALNWWNQYGPDDLGAQEPPPPPTVDPPLPPVLPPSYLDGGPTRMTTNPVPGSYMGVGEDGYGPPQGGPAGSEVIPPDGGYPATYDPYAQPPRRRRTAAGGLDWQTL